MLSHLLYFPGKVHAASQVEAILRKVLWCQQHFLLVKKSGLNFKVLNRLGM